MDKEKQIDLLADWVMVEATIECSECHTGMYIDESDPERDAYSEGWRVSADEQEVYCPKCVRKFRRNKKLHAPAQKSK